MVGVVEGEPPVVGGNRRWHRDGGCMCGGGRDLVVTHMIVVVMEVIDGRGRGPRGWKSRGRGRRQGGGHLATFSASFNHILGFI